MCELLGLSFNKPVNTTITFTGFRERGRIHRDGWGLASYRDGKANIIKESAEAAWSERSKAIATDPSCRSEIYIGHVRMISQGDRIIENTHPFKQSLNGKDFVFAHNGTLRGYKQFLRLGTFLPLGTTDSEYAFCYLMNEIKSRRLNLSTGISFDELLSVLQSINQLGKFNCLFSDGERLFAYVDVSRRGGLRFTHRKQPFHRTRLLDKDWEINLEAEKDSSEEGYVIATIPLTDEHWDRIEPSELLVFEKGKMIWSNKRDIL